MELQEWPWAGKYQQSYRMWGHMVRLEELVRFRAHIQARSDGDFHRSVPVGSRRAFIHEQRAALMWPIQTIHTRKGIVRKQRRAIVSFYVALSESSSINPRWFTLIYVSSCHYVSRFWHCFVSRSFLFLSKRVTYHSLGLHETLDHAE